MDYKTHDPKGWCGDPKRGAALGRHTYHDAPKDFDGDITVMQVHISGDGYDRNGTYFGYVPKSFVFWYANEDGTIDAVVRAATVDAAKREIAKHYPHAKLVAPSAELMLDDVVEAFVEAALAYEVISKDETHEGYDKPLADKYGPEDIDEETMIAIRLACNSFLVSNAEHIVGRAAEAGADFYHSRSGDGCGFLDGHWPDDVEHVLDDAADAFTSFDLYVGDNGKLYAESSGARIG